MEQYRPRYRAIIYSDSEEEEENVETLVVSAELHTETREATTDDEMNTETMEESVVEDDFMTPEIEQEESIVEDDVMAPEIEQEPQPAGTILFSTFAHTVEDLQTKDLEVATNEAVKTDEANLVCDDDVTTRTTENVNTDEVTLVSDDDETARVESIENVNDLETNKESILENVVITETETLESFFTENQKYFDLVAAKSNYSVYRAENVGRPLNNYQLAVNVITTNKKHKTNIHYKNKPRFKKLFDYSGTVDAVWKRWRKDFPQDDMKEYLQNALDIIKAEPAKEIRKEKKKQFGLLEFMKKVTGKKSKKMDTIDISEDFPENDETEEQQTNEAATEIRTEEPSLIESFTFDNFTFSDYRPTRAVLGELESKSKQVEEFRVESWHFKNRKVFERKNQGQPTLSDEIETETLKVEEIKALLEKANKAEIDAMKQCIGKSSTEKSEIFDEVAKVVKDLDTSIVEKLISLDLVNLTKKIRKRNQTFLSYQKSRSKQTLNRTETKFKNASKTWNQCLNSIESKGIVKFKSSCLDLDNAAAIQAAFISNEERYLTDDDLLCILNRPAIEKEDLLETCVENLPVIMIRKPEGTRIYESKSFLKDPNLLLELWENQERFASLQKEKDMVIVDVQRQKGSGRPVGSRKLKSKVIEGIQQFIEHCGQPAEERRRLDISKFGGQGSGVTWKNNVYKFVIDNFFDSDTSAVSKTTVRRAGLPPNRASRSSKLYRGDIKARPSSALNNKTLGKVHLNAQYCASTVKTAMEFAALNNEYCTAFSVDDKAKLNIGPNPVVSRLVSAPRTYLEGQVPSVPDHDIKTGSTITPRGYMVLNLEKYSANASEKEKTDEEIILEDAEDRDTEVDPDDFTLEVTETVLLEQDKSQEEVETPGETLLLTGDESETNEEQITVEPDMPMSRENSIDSILTTSSEPPAKRTQAEQSKIANVGEDVPKIKDTLGREHIPVNRTGNGYVFHASSQTNPSTIQAHINDFLSIFESNPELKKQILTIVADDGEDYSLRNNATLHYFGRLWRDLDQYRLHIVKYAPSQSKFNMIERAWSAMTKRIANIILDPERKIWKSNDPKKSPSENIDLDFLDQCFETIINALKDYKFGEDTKWRNVVVKPNSDKVVIDDEEIKNDHYSDLDDVRKFHVQKVSKKNRDEMQSNQERELLKEYKFFVKHSDVRKHALYFSRCPRYNACEDCQEYHERANLPEDFEEKINLPNKQNNGALFFEPEQDPDHKGHFKTFLRLAKELSEDKFKLFKPDSNITDGPADRCKEKDCLTTFRSQAGADRHYALLHNRNTPGVTQRLMFCTFPGCNKGFPSLHYLTKHRKKDKHQKKDETRGRKPLPPRFVDADESEDDIEINDVPSTSSNYQNTDQILGFADMEQGEETVPEQAVNEPEPVADVVQVTRKRGRPRKSHNVEESSTTVRRSARSKK